MDVSRTIPKLISVFVEGMSGKTFTISTNAALNLNPGNAMDGDQKTYVHSADVGDENFEQFPTLNITFGG